MIFFENNQFLRIDFFAKFNININRLIVIILRCSGKDPKQRNSMACANPFFNGPCKKRLPPKNPKKSIPKNQLENQLQDQFQTQKNQYPKSIKKDIFFLNEKSQLKSQLIVINPRCSGYNLSRIPSQTNLFSNLISYESNLSRISSQTNLISYESLLKRISSQTNLFSNESSLSRIYFGAFWF